MRLSISLLLVLTTGVAVGQNKKASPPKEAPVIKPRDGKTETVRLFDGMTLDGWEGYSDLWSVKDGVNRRQEHGPAQVQYLPAHVSPKRVRHRSSD